MDMHTSLLIFQAVHAVGLSVWLSISVVNNCQGFAGSAWSVGTTMAMTPLQQPPAIETPLLSRAVRSPALHRLALLVVLALQIAAAAACWAGSCLLLSSGGLDAARPWLNLGLSSFAAFLFAMHLGGVWFGYWIRQESLQLTHIALLLWTVAAFALFNGPWA